jgi:hypothetical protein
MSECADISIAEGGSYEEWGWDRKDRGRGFVGESVTMSDNGHGYRRGTKRET